MKKSIIGFSIFALLAAALMPSIKEHLRKILEN